MKNTKGETHVPNSCENAVDGAISLLLLCVCVAIGFLFDITGNYDIPFVVCGSFQTVGGLCAICVFVMKRCRRGTKHP